MLDRKTPEVEIEARVVASTRTFARDIAPSWAGLAAATVLSEAQLPPAQLTWRTDSKVYYSTG